MEEKVEGIVLRSQDYQERHRIITLFTAQEGIISLIVKNISRKNTRLLSLTTPFCHGEYLFRRGTSELLRFHDATILDDHFLLRRSLSSLQAAGTLANTILTTQMPGKAAPALFTLYRSYHKQIAHFKEPTALLASFYLKLLKHEGLLMLTPTCAHCAMPASHLHEESFCKQHATSSALSFSTEEWQLLLTLDNATQFSSLHALLVPRPLFQEITSLLHSHLLGK